LSACWFPTAGGIVPPIEPADPDRDEGRYSAFSRELENARSEYQARRFETARRMLDELISSRKSVGQQFAAARCAPFGLLLASALTLRARVCWRMAERERERGAVAAERRERRRQTAAFRQAAKTFGLFCGALQDHPTESRLRTDYGIALYRTGDAAAAMESLHAALTTGAAPVETFAYLGMALSDLGRRAEATRALEKGCQIAPRDKVLLETMAINYERECDAARARGDAEAEKANAELAIQKYCQTAIEAGRAESLNEASAMLTAALKIRPDDARPLSMLCLLLRSQGRADQARALLAKTLEDYPGNAWALGLRGLINADEGKTVDALRDFEAARVDGPELVWVTLEHAKTLAASDVRAARRLLARAAKWLESADPRVIQTRSEIEVSNAIAATATTAVRLGQRFVSWLTTSDAVAPVTEKVAGYIEQALGTSKFDRLELLTQFAKRLPDRVEPLEMLAREHMKREDWRAASEVLSEALGREPESVALLSLKADALDKLAEPQEALRFRQRCARVAPYDDHVFAAYLKALTESGRTADALRELDSRLQLTPDYGRGWMEKGRLLLKARRFHESAQALERAEILDSGNREDVLQIRFALAEALRGDNRYAEAKEALTRAIQDDDDDGNARARKALLLMDIADYADAAELLRCAVDDQKASEARRAWFENTRGWALYCDGATPREELRAIFERASSHPRFAPFARKNLAQTLLRMPGCEQQGREILSEMTEDSVNRWPLDLVGWCHFRLRRFDAAEHWLRASIEDDPDNAEATRFDLALVLLAAKSPGAATAYHVATASAECLDRLRQRGLFYIAALDAREAIEDDLLNASDGTKRLDNLIGHLSELGLGAQRLKPLMLSGRKSRTAA
jgi:predicted Zn-dependent protease